jgi:hypothetical protein
VDPHRSGHPDDLEPRHYRGEPRYAEPGGQGWGLGQTDGSGYLMPDRRGPERMMPPAQPAMGPPMMGQRAAEPMPSQPMATPPRSDNIHRARRPAAAAVVWLGAIAGMLPVVRVLFVSATGPVPSPGGVISSVLVLCGLPLAALGLHGLATSAASIPGAPIRHAWSRPPLVYLPIALALFIAAGLAAS